MKIKIALPVDDYLFYIMGKIRDILIHQKIFWVPIDINNAMVYSIWTKDQNLK